MTQITYGSQCAEGCQCREGVKAREQPRPLRGPGPQIGGGPDPVLLRHARPHHRRGGCLGRPAPRPRYGRPGRARPGRPHHGDHGGYVPHALAGQPRRRADHPPCRHVTFLKTRDGAGTSRTRSTSRDQLPTVASGMGLQGLQGREERGGLPRSLRRRCRTRLASAMAAAVARPPRNSVSTAVRMLMMRQSE